MSADEIIQEKTSHIHKLLRDIDGSLSRILTAIFYFFIAALVWHWWPSNELTVHYAQCSTAYEREECKAEEIPANRTVFKPSYAHQIVISQVKEEAAYSPVKLLNCVVLDVDNWTCLGDQNLPILSFRDGKFYDGNESPNWKVVSRWKWYYLKVCHWLPFGPSVKKA